MSIVNRSEIRDAEREMMAHSCPEKIAVQMQPCSFVFVCFGCGKRWDIDKFSAMSRIKSEITEGFQNFMRRRCTTKDAFREKP